MASVQPPQRKLLDKDFQDPGFYDQYSPNHELPYSSLASFAFHFCLMLLLPLLASIITPEDTLPPEVTVVTVADSPEDSASGAGELETPGELEATEESSEAEMPLEETDPTLEPSEELVIEETAVEEQEERVERTVTETTEAGQEIASSARQSLEDARAALSNTPGGSRGGNEEGTGSPGRAARWIMHFRATNARDYMNQMAALGAEIAFPDRGDQWLFFDLTQANPTGVVRDLSGESRMYWIEQGDSIPAICQALGIPSAEFMVTFFPIEIENRLLEMELAYMGPKQEQDILQTHFEVFRSGGGYDVRVTSQTLINP
jgi:hypothetical protein